jgi:hypothetical protein
MAFKRWVSATIKHPHLVSKNILAAPGIIRSPRVYLLKELKIITESRKGRFLAHSDNRPPEMSAGPEDLSIHPPVPEDKLILYVKKGRGYQYFHIQCHVRTSKACGSKWS